MAARHADRKDALNGRPRIAVSIPLSEGLVTTVWAVFHVGGYVTMASLALTQTVRFVRRISAASHATSQAQRIERIAKLELQLGIGLDYGREWLVTRPVACKEMYRELVKDGNGACERKCWGCDKQYRPHDEYGVASGHTPTWYKQTPEERELTDRLCRSCYLGATRRDFGVIDFVTARDE